MRNLILKGNTNEKHSLINSEDHFIVRTKNNRSFTEQKLRSNSFYQSIKNNLKELAYFPEASVYVYKIINVPAEDRLNLRDEIRSHLKKEDQISYAGKLLCFEQGNIYQIYTENMFVKFQDDVDAKYCNEIMREFDMSCKLDLGFAKNAYFLGARDNIGQDIFDMAEELLLKSEVELCHPELVAKRKSLADEFERYYISDSKQTDWSLEKINLYKAWETSTGENVNVCVIDDGIDLEHAAFRDNIYRSKDMMDFYGRRKATHQYTNERHGTACASIACANDENLKGVAPDSMLIPIRSKGLGSVLESQAFYWAAKNGADIISCSWGPPDGDIFSKSDNAIFYPIPDHTRLAIDFAATKGRGGKGCVVLLAGGNGREPIKYDGYASHSKVLAIGASNKNDEAAVYSDFGAPIFCVFPSGDYSIMNKLQLQKLYGIKVADRIGKEGYAPGDYYDLFDGTSASCPGVAGVIALMLSQNPSLSRIDIKNILKKSCKKIGQKSSYNDYKGGSYSQRFGYGLIQADLAVKETTKYSKNKKSITMENKIYALHIGINTVDQSYYGNEISELGGCVQDMRNMERLILGKYKGKLEEQISLFSERNNLDAEKLPTTVNIKSTLESWATQLEEEDFLIVTYAGHGTSVPDESNDEEDEMDEAWVCYDKLLLDDDIKKLFANFKEGVRILVISDSCHSGTTTRALQFKRYRDTKESKVRYVPLDAISRVLKNNRAFRSRSSSRSKTLHDAQASVLLLAACQDDEFAQEEGGEGVFSRNLRLAYERNPKMTYRQIMEAIKTQMPKSQNPKIDDKETNDVAFSEAYFLQSEKGIIDKADDDSKLEFKLANQEVKTSRIIVKTNKKELQIGRASSRGKAQIFKSLRMVNGSVSTGESRATNPWDSAYKLLNDLHEDQLSDIEYIEPDISSEVFIDDNYKSEAGRSASEKAEDYLSTYPNPFEFDCPDPFIWHLDDEHSQLRKAFKSLYANHYNTGIIPNISDVATIGHIDTGVFPDHPTLPLHFDFDASDRDIIDVDTTKWIEQQGHGHGTVSLLAGAEYDKENEDGFSGFYGAHPYARVVSFRISDKVALFNGKKFNRAVKKAIAANCDVITMSMAGWPSQAMAEAVNLAYEAGVVLVSAASNTYVKGVGSLLPKKTLYPARWDCVIAAVGVTFDHKPYLFDLQERNRAVGGKYMQMCYGPKEALRTTVAAYSPNVVWFGKMDAEGDKNYYDKSGGGTSSATPQIAAAAALYIDKYRDEIDELVGEEKWKKAEIVRQAIFRSANSKAYSEYLGNGILRAFDLLDDSDYSPEAIYELCELENAAPEEFTKRADASDGFLKKIFKIFRSGSSERRRAIKESMLANELLQLMHRDEKLHRYLEYDLQNPDIDQGILDDIILDVQRSSHASYFLKENLSEIISRQRSSEIKENSLYLNIGDMNDFSVKIRGKNMSLSKEEEVTEERKISNTEYELTEFAGELNPDITRGTAPAGLYVKPILENENSRCAVYIETEVDDERIGYWKFSKDFRSTDESHRSGDMENGEFYFGLDEISTPEQLRGDGTSDKAIKFFAKILKWDKQGERAAKKLVSTFIEQENYLNYYDLKNARWLNSTDLKDSALKESDIWEEINSKDHLLFLFHGLFSSVESGFGNFLKDENVRTKLLRKYGRYLVGYNMSDVLQGLNDNANGFFDLIKDHIGKKKKYTLLARSRGCMVARSFEENVLAEQRVESGEDNLTLEKMILIAPPNQGTPIARDELYQKLINVLSVLSVSASGFAGPLFSGVFKVLKYLAGEITALPGIDDLEEKSKVIKDMNLKVLDRSKYHVVISNYEPKGQLIKNIFDQLAVDKMIFRKAKNDAVVPVLGAMFANEKLFVSEGFNADAIPRLDLNKLFIVDEDFRVGHFKYLEKKTGKKKKPKNNPTPAKVLEWL